MVQSATGRKRDQGSFWMTVDSVTVEYPDDTDAGSGNATQTNSILASDTHVLCEGILVTGSDTVDRVITIEHGVSSGATAFTFTVEANQAVPLFVPFGGPDGVQLNAPFFGAFTAAAAATGHLFFRRVQNFATTS